MNISLISYILGHLVQSEFLAKENINDFVNSLEILL